MSAKFVAELSDFRWVQKRGRRVTGRILRFTLTWLLDHPDLGRLGETHEGCIAQIDKKGELQWSPPRTMIGPGRWLFTLTVTPDWYAHVLRVLQTSPYIDRLREAFTPEEPMDPEMPKTLDIAAGIGDN